VTADPGAETLRRALDLARRAVGRELLPVERDMIEKAVSDYHRTHKTLQ
jgi:hypothetical protein